jgi:hypothetical protein
MRQRILLLVAVVWTLAGCAGTEQARFDGKQPPPGGALLYVYRSHTLIGIANMDVPIIHLDGRALGRIRIGGYFALPIAPGQHRLTTTESLLGSDTGKVRGETRFSIAAGSTLYLRYTESFKTFAAIPVPHVGVFVDSTGDYRFESIPAAEATAEIAGATLLTGDK